jgi:hypothetical protein
MHMHTHTRTYYFACRNGCTRTFRSYGNRLDHEARAHRNQQNDATVLDSRARQAVTVPDSRAHQAVTSAVDERHVHPQPAFYHEYRPNFHQIMFIPDPPAYFRGQALPSQAEMDDHYSMGVLPHH